MGLNNLHCDNSSIWHEVFENMWNVMRYQVVNNFHKWIRISKICIEIKMQVIRLEVQNNKYTHIDS